MQRLTLLLLLIFCSQATFGQPQLPTIKATSSSVDVRVGEYFSRGGWILDPKKKPDVFSIGSQWPYKFKKVTFITDADSISFNVQPGCKYDFIILLNQQTACHIQIATRASPVFMKARIVIPILAGFGLLLLLLFVLRRRLAALPLLYVGYAVAFLFWICTIISERLHGHYHHFKNVVSELGAIGTNSEVFTSTSFILLAFSSILFSVGFYKASKLLHLSVIPAVLSFSKPFSMNWVLLAENGILALLFGNDVNSDKVHPTFWFDLRRAGATVFLFRLDSMDCDVKLFTYEESTRTQTI
jgi:hypothetical protein